MATNSVACTIVGHAYAYTSLGEYNKNAAYAGYNGTAYYAYILKFTTPAFTGASEGVSFGIWMNQGWGTDVTLRYAICSSDANKNSYCGTTGAVSDSNQITSGTVSLKGMSSTQEKRTVTVTTAKLKQNTTYYLILWAYNNTGVSLMNISSAWGEYSADLGYNSGLVWIDTGSGFESYQCYIDNGTSWDMCIPYIDNGTSWDMCS